MSKTVIFNRSVIESILNYSKSLHPREGILLLRGKVKKDRIIIEDVEVPPLSIHGHSFSNFPLYMLPIDFSVVGTAHSHPSGILSPSIGDLNNFYGRIMVIAAYPYNGDRQVAVFNSQGRLAKYEIIEDE